MKFIEFISLLGFVCSGIALIVIFFITNDQSTLNPNSGTFYATGISIVVLLFSCAGLGKALTTPKIGR